MSEINKVNYQTDHTTIIPYIIYIVVSLVGIIMLGLLLRGNMRWKDATITLLVLNIVSFLIGLYLTSPIYGGNDLWTALVLTIQAISAIIIYLLTVFDSTSSLVIKILTIFYPVILLPFIVDLTLSQR